MPKKSKVAFRNRNQTDWWIYTEVEYFVRKNQEKLRPQSRCTVWENLRIIQAKTREQAFKKALKLSSSGFPSVADGGEWRFAGITDLMPIYEELEDGAEILWCDRGRMAFNKIKKVAALQKKMQVFDDSPSERANV